MILGCTGDTPITTMRCVLGLTLAKSKHALAQANAYTNDDRQALFINLKYTKGRRLKMGKSWITEAEDKWDT